MTEIKKRLQLILDKIKKAELSAQRSSNSVQLLAVSKTWPAEKLREVAEQGQRLFGENYLQEALEKIDALQGLPIEWHFIGPIQSNKTRDIAAKFDWAHSVDRLKIAKRLAEQRPLNLPDLNICIQVNIDSEETKSGVNASELMLLAEQVSKLDRLCLRGLMIIPARHDNEKDQRESFQRANNLFKQLQAQYPQVDTLSMGMSSDMEIAIEEGSTMVRIGTALFGERQRKQSE